MPGVTPLSGDFEIRLKAVPLFPSDEPLVTLQDGGTIMRFLTLVSVLGVTTLAEAAWGQTLTEFGAAAAGGSVAGASGRKVNDGINSIFGKVNGTTDKAAATGKPAAKAPAAKQQPALEVSPGVPTADSGGVPPPPETHTAVHKAAPEPPPVITVAEVAPVAPPPPPPQMTAENLKQV